MATSSLPVHRNLNIWRSLVDAIKGTQQDFTQGSISRAVFLLATPMVLEMLMEALFAIVDVFWVTRLGSNAIATVGLTETMFTLVFSVALGISLSTTAMVARRVGEKDFEGASTAAVQAIALGLVVAVSVGVPALLFAHKLLELMGAAPDLIASGHRYTEIAFGGTITVMLLFLNNAIFRGAGDASIAMRILWFANLINLALDPCLIFGLGPFPRLGVTGAAVSTLIGRSCGVLYQFWMLTRPGGRVVIRRTNLRLVPKVIGSLIRVSSTGVLQFAIGHTSWIMLVRIISSFGSAAVAGYTIAVRTFFFVILPAWGLSGAAATMVGQNLGAHKPDRAVKAVYQTAFYNAIYMGTIAVIFIAFPYTIVHAFTRDPNVVPTAVDCLRIVGFGNVFYGLGMVLVQSFNGAGDTVTPTLINLVGFWLCELPLAYFLAYHLGWHVRGVFVAIPSAEVIICSLGAMMFLRGTWKKRKI